MTLSARIFISGQRSSIRCCWLIRIQPIAVFSTSAFVPLCVSLPKMGSRPLATIVTCTMHGLRHAPGSCQVEVSLGMGILALVVMFVCGFGAGMEFPRKGRNLGTKIELILTRGFQGSSRKAKKTSFSNCPIPQIFVSLKAENWSKFLSNFQL